LSNDLAIEAIAVEKSYGAVTVLRGLDLAVSRGTVFGLLGPNGAGKTTMVRILATLTRPDRGHARVAGFDVVADRHSVRSEISLTGQYAAVDEPQSGEENLRMLGRLSGLDRAAARVRARELLEQFDLTDAGRRRVATYSGGMRRRLDLAASLVRRPSVMFLDEPTTGLDPRSREAMWDVIARLVDTGVTVFLTTQYLEEADRLADRVAIFDHGRVVADGSPAELKRLFAEKRLDLVLADPAAFERAARSLAARAVACDAERLVIRMATDGSATHVRALLDEVDAEHSAVESFSLHSATLDDVFMALTDHTAAEPGQGARECLTH
jgi:ABC-2 type transport system ATP-binding protein